MRRGIAFFAFTLGLFCLGSVRGNTIQYSHDNGVLATSYSAKGWGYAYANYFTIAESVPVTIEAVVVRRPPAISGKTRADIYLWEDNGGLPGAELGNLTYQYLSSGWNTLDFSSMGIVVSPGQSVFAGFHPVTSDVAYDSQSPGAGMSYWQETSGGAWAVGGPQNQSRNLMVRLNVTPMSGPDPTAIPEPATLTLLGLGVAGLASRLRRRRI